MSRFTQLRDRLIELSRLKQDWDSYHAKPPTSAAIERARQLIDIFEKADFVPTVHGGIIAELDYPDGTAYLTIDSYGHVVFQFWEND